MVARSPVSLFMAWMIRPRSPTHSVSAPKSPMNQLWSVSAEASSISVTRGPSRIQQRRAEARRERERDEYRVHRLTAADRFIS